MKRLAFILIMCMCGGFLSCTRKQPEVERQFVRNDSVLTDEVYYNRAYWE